MLCNTFYTLYSEVKTPTDRVAHVFATTSVQYLFVVIVYSAESSTVQ